MLIPSNKKTFESTYDGKPLYTDFTDIYNKFRDLINSKIRIKTHFIVIKIIDYKKKKEKKRIFFPFVLDAEELIKTKGEEGEIPPFALIERFYDTVKNAIE